MSKTSKIHTRTYRGKWVRVELRNGQRFTAQFIERTPDNRYLRFKGIDRRIKKKEISRFICFGSFSPNSDFSRLNPWDTTTPDQI